MAKPTKAAPEPRAEGGWQGLTVILASLAIIVGGLALASKAGVITFEHFSIVLVLRGPKSIGVFEGIMALGLMPLAIRYRGRVSYVRQLREQVIELLQIYPNIFSSAKSIDEALEVSISLMESPLRDLLERLRLVYRSTGDLEGAFKKVFSEVPRDVRLLLLSIIVVGRSGGRARELLELASKYAIDLDRMDYTIANRLRTYGMITFIAIAVFGIATAISLDLVGALAGAPTIQAAGIGTAPAAHISVTALLGMMYYTLLMLSTASAYVLAKSIDGYAPRSIEYFVELSALGTLTMLLGLLAMGVH